MDATWRDRVRDDLRGVFRGDLCIDDLTRTLYATDASMFYVAPLAVARPCDEADLQTLVRYAQEHHLPLIPRGAGTGLAGESLGRGIIVDLGVHFRQIVRIGSDSVTVQPGVVLQELNRALATVGRRFAPDPASQEVCTIGGMLATNASGNRSAIYGYTRDYVSLLRVVWDNGEAATVGREPLPLPLPTATAGIHTTRTAEIVRSVVALLTRHREQWSSARLRTPFDRCAYPLHDVLGPDGLDLDRLLIGSEGTLAFFTEATLRTIPLAGGRGMALFAFARLETALKAAQLARPARPTVCDLLDRRLIALARGQSPEHARLIPASAEAILLVEFEADTPTEAREKVLALVDLLQRRRKLALLACTGFDPVSIERLWSVRNAAMPGLYAMKHGARPLAFVEDVGVPVEELPQFVTRVQSILQSFETTASFLIHATTGQVHTRPFLDYENPDDARKLWAIAEQVHGLAIELGGTISSQHGTGLARTPWVERQYGRLYPTLRELKTIFDPQGILNPGKIIGPDPSQPAWPLRPPLQRNLPMAAANAAEVPRNGSSPPPLPLPTTPPFPAPQRDTPQPTKQRLELFRHPGDMLDQVSACNSCGDCRTESTQQRMCPIFRIHPVEEASPRAKANLLRWLLSDEGDPKRLGGDDVRKIADLCINCKMCARECIARVNVPKLMLEAKAANQAEHGLNRTDWLLARTESFAALGSNFAFITNTLLGNPAFRWLLDRFFGISRHRRLSAFASVSFLREARRRGWTRKKRRPLSNALSESTTRRWDEVNKVAYFVDVFANYTDPQIGEATVRVLQHHGIEVYVPPGQVGSGIAPLSVGDTESARESAQTNLRLFADLVREGYYILCSEPTAALMFRQDYRDLTNDPDALLVADHTAELTSFLGRLHQHGRLKRDFRPLDLTVGHHVPCHLKALGDPIATPTLLGLIPKLRVVPIDVSCSGMAGTFGLRADKYEDSLRAGKPMLEEMRRPRIQFGVTECNSCRMQMEEGSHKRTLHPVQYLAYAYGLLPAVEKRLLRPLGDLLSD